MNCAQSADTSAKNGEALQASYDSVWSSIRSLFSRKRTSEAFLPRHVPQIAVKEYMRCPVDSHDSTDGLQIPFRVLVVCFVRNLAFQSEETLLRTTSGACTYET